MSLANELRIRSNGGHEGSQELEIMCGKAADEIERLERELAHERSKIGMLVEKIVTTEAQAAAMRSVLENFSITNPDGDDFQWLRFHGNNVQGAAAINLGASKRLICQVASLLEEDRQAALSTDAGRRVQDVVEAARHFMCEDMASHVADANSQPLSEAWNKLNEALAAMGK